MFPKLILSGVVALGAVAGVSLTPASATAHERWNRHERRHHDRYEVRVLHAGCWEVQGNFRSRSDALCEAERLRHCGFVVDIRSC